MGPRRSMGRGLCGSRWALGGRCVGLLTRRCEDRGDRGEATRYRVPYRLGSPREKVARSVYHNTLTGLSKQMCIHRSQRGQVGGARGPGAAAGGLVCRVIYCERGRSRAPAPRRGWRRERPRDPPKLGRRRSVRRNAFHTTFTALTRRDTGVPRDLVYFMALHSSLAPKCEKRDDRRASSPAATSDAPRLPVRPGHA